MKRRFLLFSLVGVVALAAALVTVVPAVASSFTVSPWAYACGHTNFGNPATATATCDGSEGTATAAYTGGVLTLSKNGPTASDLASGATIGGLVTLTAASWDLAEGSYCGAGAPRLNVVTDNGTPDGLIHFFGCAANNSGGHVSIDLSAAGDGAGNGGVKPTDKVLAIDIVQDESTLGVEGPGTPAILTRLSFTGSAPTPTPCATPSAAPSATPSPTEVPSPSPTPTQEPSPTPTEVPPPTPTETPTPTISITAYITATCPTTRPTPRPPTTGVGYNQTPPVAWLLALFAVVAINGGLFLFARRK